MNNFQTNDIVRYIGPSNRWTFREDLETNNVGVVKEIYENEGQRYCLVDIKNGIQAVLDVDDLQIIDKI